MASGGPSAGGMELDDLDDYGFEDTNDPDDPFSSAWVNPNTKSKIKNVDSGSKGNPAASAGLGIDEEVEVTKKARVPRVKLDEKLLLSEAGIPKLRKKAKTQLKFKGKGHEYSDCAKLLAFYQLWLDDLFPKARFLDALAMVEKMGHKKQMQSMRMEWINEGKPRIAEEDDSIFDDPATTLENGGREKTASRIAPIFEKSATARPKTPDPNGDVDMDDLYDATPKRAPAQPENPTSSLSGGGASIFGPQEVNDDAPPEDDFDALLAENESAKKQATENARKAPTQEDDFDDDLDALLAEEESMQAEKVKPKAAAVVEDDFDDDMEAMMAMEG